MPKSASISSRSANLQIPNYLCATSADVICEIPFLFMYVRYTSLAAGAAKLPPKPTFSISAITDISGL